MMSNLNKRSSLLMVLLTIPALAAADVLQTFVWKPMPGKHVQTVQNGLVAKPIHERLGAAVYVRWDQIGTMYYTVRFKTWADYAKFQVDGQNDPEWQSVFAKMNESPVAELIGTTLIEDVPVPGKP